MELRLVIYWFEKHAIPDSTTGLKQGWPDILVIYVKIPPHAKVKLLPFSLCVSMKFHNGFSFT